MSRKHTTKSTESDFRFLERDACIELKIPDHLHGAVVELVEKVKSTRIDVYRIRLCAWLLVVARNRPESDFPEGKNVPMPDYVLAGALHGIDNGDEHREEVGRRYAQGRKARQHVQASAKAARMQFDKILTKNRLALPPWIQEEAQQVLLALERFIAYADPGEDLLKRVRAKDKQEAFSPNSLALIWWRYYLHSPRNQYWSDMFTLATLWGVTSAANLGSFSRFVRELTQHSDHLPTPPFVKGAWCPLSQYSVRSTFM